MTCRPATASAATRRGPSTSSSLKRTVAFWLVSAVLVANVIRFAECRSFQENKLRQGPGSVSDYVEDGPDGSEDDDSDISVAENNLNKDPPIILTTGLTFDVSEGTTVNLPCKVPEKVGDNFALLWINGTKSIMTDTSSSTTDPRVKAGAPALKGSGFVENTLVIELVTRWDSGSYTCRITSEPLVSITHTLRVTHPAKILSVQAMGSGKSQQNTVVKKLTLKQGDPVQLVCNVTGYPEPTVQWTKRPRYNQQQATAAQQSSGLEINTAAIVPVSVVVSNTNEVRIDSVSAYHDAGYYECTAHNSATVLTVSEDGTSANSARSEIEIEIEFQPDVTVPRLVVNTGETYTAVLTCIVHSFPKAKVTWEKEIIGANGSSMWKKLVNEDSNGRYEFFRQPNPAAAAGNRTTVITGTNYIMKVKQVMGPQDFGRYRCSADNRVGNSYSDLITLTGSPARPQMSHVQVKDSTPELGWVVDSWSPLAEYQLQYKQQQDSQATWTDVRPQPQVVETGSNAGDERRYTVSYAFDDGRQHQQQAGESALVPPTLQHGVTYVARLRARNVHGWSDWSPEVVFSGGMDEDQDANEIAQQNGNQHKDDQVLKSSIGSSGVGQYCSATTTVLLAVSAMVATAVSIC